MKPFADHFSGIALAYAAARPTYPPPLFAYLARDWRPAHRRAWDCAAGNGQATLELAPYFDGGGGHRRERGAVGAGPRGSRRDLPRAPAEASGLPDDSVDLVTVAQALHWLDAAGILGRGAAGARRGGVVAVWCYGSSTGPAPVDGGCWRFYREVVGPYWAPERRLVETGYRTLEFPFEELAPPSFDMALEWTLRSCWPTCAPGPPPADS